MDGKANEGGKVTIRKDETETLWVEAYRPQTIAECILPSKTREVIEGFLASGEIPNLILYSSTGGSGKAQPLTSSVLTPSGYIKMGDVQVGTSVIDGDGNTTEVVGVYPQGKRPVYRITFNDRTSIEVSDEHLNSIFYYDENKKTDVDMVVTTNELLGLFEKYGSRLRVRTPRIHFDDAVLPIDPYLMGLMLGDGSLSSNNFYITLAEQDIKEKVAKILSTLGYELHHKAKYDYSIVQTKKSNQSKLKDAFRDLNLNCKSTEKHIPKMYMFSSVEQRLQLLRGLFDSDGYIETRISKGKYTTIAYEFSTSSKQLSDDFAFLVRSLGIVDTVRCKSKTGYRLPSGEFKQCAKSYRHYLQVPNDLIIFSSEKHRAKYKKRNARVIRKITSIERIEDQVCQCIKVKADCHTYITDNVTVTHNTTTARALCRELGYDTLFINASLENGIDVLRNKITAFATTVSFTGNKKCVILDEADYTSSQLQPALRGFMEQFSRNVRFIFTCNFINRLLPQIVSRCTAISFDPTREDRKELLKQSIVRLAEILRNEHIEFDKEVLAQLLKAHFPDIRRCINELQRYSASGRIDSGIFVNPNANNYGALIASLKSKNFTDMRKWVAENADIEPSRIFRYMFEHGKEFMVMQSVPELVLLTADYQYKSSFVIDQEINLSAYFTEVMLKCEFT